MGLWARISISLVMLSAIPALGQNRLFFGINGQSSGPPPACSLTSYNVPFTTTENPISQSGCWVSGHTAGTAGGTCNGGFCWGDVRVTSNHAIASDVPNTFGDATAILKPTSPGGAWSSNQTATGTIFSTTGSTGDSNEVEIRLRTTISTGPPSITGYEILCNVSGASYGSQVVRWNGPNGNFTYLADSGPNCVNGDTWSATITGGSTNTQIVVKRNGSTVTFKDPNTGNPLTTITDPTTPNWTSGNPGMGFCCNGSPFTSFGFTSWNATSP